MVRKFLWVLLLGLVIGALANDKLPEPAGVDYPHPGDSWITSGTFVSAAGGYARGDWVGFDRSVFISYSANPRGGMTYGFTVGYRFYPYFAIEGGWFKLPTVKGIGRTNASSDLPLSDMGVSSWFGYVMGKFFLHLAHHFYLNVGVGVTYREVHPRPAEFFTNSQAYYYAPIFTAGFQWDIQQDWLLYWQYIYVPSFDDDIRVQSSKKFNVPSASLFVFGVGYKFSL